MPDFAELKQRQAVVWSKGRFEDIAFTLADMHSALVESIGPRPGMRWLDLACGTGNLAELAAGGGATVVGVDISPRLIDVAKERAAAGGYAIDYRLGDCEHLVGIDDASFDAVTSSVGIIFAPDHEAAARELARVTRPGGHVAVSAWTREGSVGQFFAIAARFQPPPPPGAGSSLDWGDEAHVRDLLGADFELTFERRMSRMEVESLEAGWDLIATRFGPVVTALELLQGEQRDAFRDTMFEHFRSTVGPDGRMVDDREYLLITGVRR